MARIRFAAILPAILSLCGCDAPPAPVSVEALAFPVLRVTGTARNGVLPCRVDVFRTAEGLSHMRVEMYSEMTDRTRADAPIVIDSQARAYDMDKIAGERGTLWMMANPTGMMPLRFSLIPRRSTGIAAARDLLPGCKYLGSGFDHAVLDRRRELIRQADSMAMIIEVVAGMHDEEKPARAKTR